jgi:hypothetical protein
MTRTAFHPNLTATALAALLLVLACVSLTAAAPGDQNSAPDSPHLQQAQRQLNDVLEAPAFQRWQRRQKRSETTGQNQGLVPDAWWQWVSDQRQAFFDWLDGFFPSGQRSGGTAGPGGTGMTLAGALEILAWGVLIVVALFLLTLLFRMVMSLGGRREPTPVSRQRLREAMESGQALAADSPRWLDEADQLAAEQDLRRSFRALYLAMLSGLHRAELIDFRPNRTNWTYVRQFRGQNDHRQRLAQLTEQFDAIWYGRQSPHHPAMQQARAQVRALVGDTTESDVSAADPPRAEGGPH